MYLQGLQKVDCKEVRRLKTQVACEKLIQSKVLTGTSTQERQQHSWQRIQSTSASRLPESGSGTKPTMWSQTTQRYLHPSASWAWVSKLQGRWRLIGLRSSRQLMQRSKLARCAFLLFGWFSLPSLTHLQTSPTYIPSSGRQHLKASLWTDKEDGSFSLNPSMSCRIAIVCGFNKSSRLEP